MSHNLSLPWSSVREDLAFGTLRPRPVISSPGASSILAAIALAVGFPSSAASQVSQCFGSAGTALCSTAGTCTIQQEVVIADGATIDCETTNIVVSGPGGALVSEGHRFTIRAGDLTVEPGGRVTAVAASSERTGFEFILSGTADVGGKLEAVNGGRGSRVAISASEGITIAGTGTAIDVTGANQGLDGGTVVLNSPAGIVVDSLIDASGFNGSGEQNETYGGDIFISAGVDLSVSNELRSTGRRLGGGGVFLEAINNITIAAPNGLLNVEGRGEYGYGGQVDLSAGNAITYTGTAILRGGANSGGGLAGGGELELSAGCGGILVSGPIDATGGDDYGGDIYISAEGPVTISSAIDASAIKYAGGGGTVQIVSKRAVQLAPSASIKANGNDGASAADRGPGGIIDIFGCTVEVAAGARVEAKANPGGEVTVRANKAPLGTAPDSSMHLDTGAWIDVSGSGTSGTIVLQAKATRVGECSNTGAACSVSSSCVSGCETGTCGGASPNFEGTLTQFSIQPTVTHILDLPACGSCP